MTGHLDLAKAFVWSKFGPEAGEPVAAIFARKERERQACGGIFLWGIGSSIGGSIEALLRSGVDPLVAFTPMKSAAKAHDVAPAAVMRWVAGVGLDGNPYQVPEGSLVTSRQSKAGKREHYALVLRSEAPLTPSSVGQLDARRVRNLVSGAQVGASQVTAVVERFEPVDVSPPALYDVAVVARLHPPYFVRLNRVHGAPSIDLFG